MDMETYDLSKQKADSTLLKEKACPVLDSSYQTKLCLHELDLQ